MAAKLLLMLSAPAFGAEPSEPPQLAQPVPPNEPAAPTPVPPSVDTEGRAEPKATSPGSVSAEPNTALGAAAPGNPGAEPPVTGDASGFFSQEGAATVDTSVSYPKLDLSGFADFTFVKNVSPSDSPLRGIVQPYSSFSVGNLNLYLSAALAEQWSLLAEVRFLYLPQGNTAYPTAPGQVVAPYDATAQDAASDNRPLTWGGIQIQRAQIDYTLHPLLSLRFGQWLTPVGIWNVDHGSPVVIGVYRPYIVGQGLFPERQTGIQASGEWTTGAHLIGYALTLSNGRGPSDSYADLDENKAIGGRLHWTSRLFGELTVGASAYRGSYASRNLEYQLIVPEGEAPVLDAVSPLTVSYREQSIGGDIRFTYEGLLVQGEVMQHEVVYDDGLHLQLNGAVHADYRERGYYALAGYRLPWFGIMPFGTIEAYDFGSVSFVAPGWAASLGLNVRPQPTVVFKLQGNWVQLGSDSSDEPYRGNLRRILAQLAVAF